MSSSLVECAVNDPEAENEKDNFSESEVEIALEYAKEFAKERKKTEHAKVLTAAENKSTLTRLLNPSGGDSQWMYQDHANELGIGGRSDTLERNPGFVNPRQLENNTNARQINNDQMGDSDLDRALQKPIVMVQEPPVPVAVVKQEEARSPVVVGRGHPVAAQKQVIFNENNTVTVVQTSNTDPMWNIEDIEALNTAAGGPGGDNNQSPTGTNPAITAWPGQYSFSMHFQQLSTKSKSKEWAFSHDLNKLFIDMGKYIQIGFSAGDSPPENVYIRAVPIYAVPEFFTDPVKRCPNHASLSDSSNKDFPTEFSEHLIRANHEGAVYDEDPNSGRLSLIIPFERPQVGTNHCSHLIKFMCLGSDVGGINRKPVKLVFTLEQGDLKPGCPGEVIGRISMDVRICSCPKRDMQQEETKFRRDRDKALGLADSLARSNSVLTKPSGKKRKLDMEEFVMMPVAKADFEKLNEFAEAAAIMRNPTKGKEIKELRRNLLEKHNKSHFNKPR